VACPRPPLPAMQQPRPQQAFVAQHNGIAEASWLRQLLHELHASLHRATLVYCDNINAVYMSSNQSNISAPSTSRLIFNSFESELLLVIFAWF